jgi:transposase
MRASYDSLFERVKRILKKNPFSGHLFVFINEKRNSCKCLYYDGTGFVILSKRLERGQFSMVNSRYRGEVCLTAAEFGLFFQGANLEGRFVDSPVVLRKFMKIRNSWLNQKTEYSTGSGDKSTLGHSNSGRLKEDQSRSLA